MNTLEQAPAVSPGAVRVADEMLHVVKAYQRMKQQLQTQNSAEWSAQIILRCLAKQPEQRPEDAATLAKLLREVPHAWTDEDAAAWTAIRPLMEAEDEATFQTLRRYFLDGEPSRPIAAERADAETLYAVLRTLGGEKLVGSGTGLPAGLYWGEGRSPG